MLTFLQIRLRKPDTFYSSRFRRQWVAKVLGGVPGAQGTCFCVLTHRTDASTIRTRWVVRFGEGLDISRTRSSRHLLERSRLIGFCHRELRNKCTSEHLCYMCKNIATVWTSLIVVPRFHKNSISWLLSVSCSESARQYYRICQKSRPENRPFPRFPPVFVWLSLILWIFWWKSHNVDAKIMFLYTKCIKNMKIFFRNALQASGTESLVIFSTRAGSSSWMTFLWWTLHFTTESE